MAAPPPSRSAAHALHALVRRQFPHLPTTSAPVSGYAFLGAGPASDMQRPATAATSAPHPPVLATVAFPVADPTHLFPPLPPFAPPPLGPPALARAASVPAPNMQYVAAADRTPRAAAAAGAGSRAATVLGGGPPLTPSPALRALHPSTPTGTDTPAPSLADLARVESQLDFTSTGCKGRAVTADMQDAFVRTLAAVHTIVKDKLYRARTPTMEQYFTQYHKISRAQVYRLLDCHAIMQDLRDFHRKPLKQRICRTLKKVTPAREPRRRLWQAVVTKWGHDPAAMANLTSADIVTTWTDLVENDAALRAAAAAASVDESDADALDASDPAWADQTGSPASVPPATPTPAPVPLPRPPVPTAMAAWAAVATANNPWPDDAMWAGIAATPMPVDAAMHIKTEPATLFPTAPLPVPHAHLADWWSARADHFAPGATAEFHPSRHRSPAPPPAGPATTDRGHPVVVFSVRASSAAPAPATPTPARDVPRQTPDPIMAAATDLTSPLRMVDPPPPPASVTATPPPTRGARGKARGKTRGTRGTRGSTTKARGGRGRGKAAAAARDAVLVPVPPKVEDEEDDEVASPAVKRRRRSRAEILVDEAAAAFAGRPARTAGSSARSRARRVPAGGAPAAGTGTTEVVAGEETVKIKVEVPPPHVKTDPERDMPRATHVGGVAPAPAPVSVPAPGPAAVPPPPPPAPAPNVVLQLSPPMRALPPSSTRPTLLEPTRVDDTCADFDADCLARLAASPVYATRRPVARYRTASAGGYAPLPPPPPSALGFIPPASTAGLPAPAAMPMPTASHSPWPSPRYRVPSFGLGLGLALPLPPPPPPPPAVSARSRTVSGVPADLAAAVDTPPWGMTRPGTPNGGGGGGAWVLASPRIDPARIGIQAPQARARDVSWSGGIAPYYLHAPMPAGPDGGYDYAGGTWTGAAGGGGMESASAGPWWMSVDAAAPVGDAAPVVDEHGKGHGLQDVEMMTGVRSAPVDGGGPALLFDAQ
ncbi:hypothetical protein GGF32_007392 [Allomyces javanicus]|nr:hypothetical protein GGF32_007392 [Allomyces javanicus]